MEEVSPEDLDLLKEYMKLDEEELQNDEKKEDDTHQQSKSNISVVS
jgi:hypothetical protein